MSSHRPSRLDPLRPRRAAALAATLLLAALALVGPMPAAAQDADPPRPGPDVFGETIEVRVVNVEVVVTDRDGNRVIGLEPGDFRLFVDGDEVEIDYFSEIVGGRVTAPEAEAAEEGVEGVPAAVPGEPLGTRYLLFVDDYWSIPRDRNTALQAIADDLSFLGPGDSMAVVAFDGEGVDMLTSWTDSPRQLRRALSDAQARPASGFNRLSDLRSHDRSLFAARDARSASGIQSLPVEDRIFALDVARDVERTVSGAVATLRGFARPAGRKVMLLLAGGWPHSPAAYAVGSQRQPQWDVPEGDELLRPLVDTANLLGYTLYPVDVPGLGTSAGAGVEQGGRLASGLAVDDEARVEVTANVARERENNVEDTLRVLAEETGGRAMVDAVSAEPLARVAEDTRSYYWLGFTPERARDDRRHELRVEVTRPGLRVRTRDSYLDISTAAERTMAVESALLFGDDSFAHALPVELGEPERAGRRTMEVPLRIAIPTDLLTLLPEEDGWVARVELRAAALDESDRTSDVPSVPLEFRFPEKPGAGKAVPYETPLTLRRTEQVLVVTVTDVPSGRSASARVEVAP